MLNKNIKAKKVPIKGQVIKYKEQKPCSHCGKMKPLANKTKRLCATCLIKQKKEKQKARKEYKKRIKQETVTQTKLDQLTSWLIRAAYPMKCPHCKITLEPKTSQCGHFVGRTRQSTRYSLKNLAAIDRQCNFYRPEHSYSLGKFLDTIWGEGTADSQIELSLKRLKLSNYDRGLIYKIYNEALKKVQTTNSQEEKYKILKETQELYEQIINPLLFI